MAAMAAFTFSSCEDVPEPYTLPTKPETPGNTDPNQKGSESNPYTVTETIALIKTGTAPSTAVCVKGKITAVTFFNATYSSLSYNIADEGSSDVIEVYSGKGKDGANFSSKDDLKVGQTVVVKGIVKAFTKNDGTIVNEIDKNSTIISIENTGTTSPDTPTTGKGSLSDPYNVAEAIAAIKAGTAPTTQVYLTGIISDVAFYNETYKSITYYISDDGKSKDMQVYSGKGLNGADFASKEDLKVGQKVTILGKIMKFVDKNNNEIMEVDKTSSIVKIEGEGTGGGEVKPDPAPGTNAGITINDLTVTLANSGVTAGESLKISISPISNISERIRVIDYKTGRAQTTHPKDIAEMFSATPQALSKHTDYYLQAFLYSMIIKNSKRYNSAQDPVSPGLLFIQNAGAEDYDPTLKLGREKIEDITPYEEDFMAHLRSLIADIYNPALPLRPTCDKKRCEYCPYAGLCK